MTLTQFFTGIAFLVLLLLALAMLAEWVRRMYSACSDVPDQANADAFPAHVECTTSINHGKEDHEEEGRPKEEGRSEEEGSKKDRTQKGGQAAEAKAPHQCGASQQAGREGRPQAQGDGPRAPRKPHRPRVHRDAQQPRRLDPQRQQPPKPEE